MAQNFEALHLNVQLPVGPSGETRRAVLFGEVRMSANHRAETQMRGDTDFLQGIVDLWNESPLAIKGKTILS